MSQKTSIKVAQTAGFCWGVKRAMDMTLKTANEASEVVYTHGPLIHNPQVIQMLEGKRVVAVQDASALDSGSVIIRTHGVTPQVRKSIKDRGLKVSDATCPLVAKVQGIIKKHARMGYSTVIVGDKGHAEVTGLLGYAEGRGTVIGALEEVVSLPDMDKVCVVAQTTCDVGRYKEITEALMKRYKDIVLGDTICEATQDRQDEVLKLASEVELMVVVGGKNSANTARLAQIAKQAGADTLLVETEEELDPEYVRKYGAIGLTAGASTPAWMIQRTLDRLNEITAQGDNSWAGRIFGAARALVVSNVSVAAGAAFMTMASGVLAGYSPSYLSMALAAAYIFAMYALNQLHDTLTYKHNEPERYRFTLERKRFMEVSAVAASLAALAMAGALGLGAFLILSGAVALGLGYTVKWFPQANWLPIHRFKDIPASKEIFVGAGWAVVCALIPAMASGVAPFSAPVLVSFMFVFLVVYIRAVVSDIRDIQGDRVMGRETIPILIGKEATKAFVGMLCLALAGLLVISAWTGAVQPFGYWLLATAAYTVLYLLLYHLRVIHRGTAFDLAIDGVFHVTGLLAVLYLALP